LFKTFETHNSLRRYSVHLGHVLQYTDNALSVRGFMDMSAEVIIY